jgi:hypothetical protein
MLFGLVGDFSETLNRFFNAAVDVLEAASSVNAAVLANEYCENRASSFLTY